MGMAQAEIEQYLEQREKDDEPSEDEANEDPLDQAEFECWPGTIPAMELFIRVRRHWQRRGLDGNPVALDPHAVEIMMRLSGCREDLDLFEDVMTIGDGAVAEMQERTRG